MDDIELKMQSNMINSILKSKWNDSRSAFDVDLRDVETYGVNPYYDYNHYLFLKRELDVTADAWNQAKKDGLIRHAKLYRGKFLDYVVHKEFNTIEEWVADAGGKVEDVLYGENRVKEKWVWIWDPVSRQHTRSEYKAKYVSLALLLQRLGYVAPPEVDTVTAVDEHKQKCEKLTEMLAVEMGMRGLGIGRVYVLDEANVLVPWSSFVTN